MAYPRSAHPSRSLFPAPASLRALVRYFHIEHNSAGQVKLPASPYPMLTFFIAGGAVRVDADGSVRLFDAPFLAGPIMSALDATWLPGTSFVSAVCEPATFGELFGVSAPAMRDQAVALSDAAPHLATDAVQESLRRCAAPAAFAEVLGHWLLALARQREERLLRGFTLPGAFLFSPAGEIASRFGLSVRQLERKHLAAYGMTMRESRRMARYTAALYLLIRYPRRRGLLTMIAATAGYHDQAHMIHDFQALIGITPGGMTDSDDLDDSLRLLRYDSRESRIIGEAGKDPAHALPDLPMALAIP